jgi:hypothetical protein
LRLKQSFCGCEPWWRVRDGGRHLARSPFFVIGVLISAEVTGWQALRLYVALAPIAATLILLGVNLVIAAIFGLLAMRSSPGHAEQEALRVRRQALDAARGSLTLTAIVPVATTLLRRRRGGRQQPWLQRFR